MAADTATKTAARGLTGFWYSEDKLKVSKAFAIKLFPSDLNDPDQSVLNAGVEYFFGDRFGIEVSAGMGLGNRAWLVYPFYDVADVNKDIRVALEPRLYWHNKKSRRSYFSLSGYYRRKEMVMDRWRYVPHESIYAYSFDHGSFDQDQAGVALQCGMQFFFGKHLTVEMALGLGYMTWNNYFSNLEHVAPVKDGLVRNLFDLYTTTIYRNQWEHGAGGLYLPAHIKIGFVLP